MFAVCPQMALVGQFFLKLLVADVAVEDDHWCHLSIRVVLPKAHNCSLGLHGLLRNKVTHNFVKCFHFSAMHSM